MFDLTWPRVDCVPLYNQQPEYDLSKKNVGILSHIQKQARTGRRQAVQHPDGRTLFCNMVFNTQNLTKTVLRRV